MYEFYMLALLSVLNIALIFLAKIPLLSIILGSVSFAVGVAALGVADVPFQPYMTVLLCLLAGVSILSAAINLRSGD